MPDNLTPEDRLRTMRAVKSKDTAPERRIKALLNELGIVGWETHYDAVAGKPDIAFPEQKIAIFVNGCFWHGCPTCQRPLPQTNIKYWRRKIQRNIDRDKRYKEELEALGWQVIRIWEHQLKKGEPMESLRLSLQEKLHDLEREKGADESRNQ